LINNDLGSTLKIKFGKIITYKHLRQSLQINNFIRNNMNKLLLAGLLLVVVLCGEFRTNRGAYIPITAGKQNVINFGCGIGDSYNNIAGVSSAGYTFTYSNLPSWVGVVNGPMIAGTPTTATPTAIQVFYTDSNGNQGSQTVVLAGSGTNANALVTVPAGTKAGATTTTTNGGRLPVSQFSSIQYVPGSTVAAPGATTRGSNGPDANLVTVVLPALVYPTPGRLSIIPPDAPSTSARRPSAPISNPEEDAAIVARQEAAMRGLANALDALNKANTNYNNLQNQVGNSQNDLNNALDYLQNTRNALRDAQNQQGGNSQQIITVTTDLSNIQSQIDAANNDIAGLNANINDLQNNLNNAGPALAAAQRNLDDVNANITALTNAINDAQNSIDGANSRITSLKKTVTETQAILDNWPAAFAKLKNDINKNQDRVERARRELADALAEQDDLNTKLTQFQATKTNAPKIISDANSQIDQITNTLPGLNNKLKNLNDQLNNLLNAKKAAADNIDNIKNSIGDLGKKLADLRKNLGDRQTALGRYQSQLNQATQTLLQLKNNQKVLDDNVNTLLEQLGLAENNVNNARSVCDDLAVQIRNAENLINAAKVAIERARTEKALSDQEINESIQRQGGNFPYPYIPGTGPYAIPGVTGNAATGTANPYAPGTVFGTGPGTTGRGAGSGLPVSAAPGSPYNALVSPVAGISGNRIVSASQAGNVSPSALFPAGTGAFKAGNAGYKAGHGRRDGDDGCFANAASSNVLSGSGRVVETGENWYALHNGYKVYTAPCTQGCKGKIGDNVNWNGYNEKGTFLATKLSCS
jgi:peptidoglycan hydrolase CwlO-like protein